MLTNYHGFHLIEALHLKKAAHQFTASRYFRMVICAIIGLVMAWLPTEFYHIDGLTVIEQRVIALFVFAGLMWITEAMPAWGTSFLVIVIMLLTVSNAPLSFFDVGEVTGDYGRPIPYKNILAVFADPTIELFIGGFVLAIGLTKTGLDMFIAKVLLKPFGTKSENVLMGFILVTAVLSAFVSNTATAAMMVAFLAPVLKSLPADGKGRIALAMAIPIGANIGGIATPIGTPPNLIALGYLQEQLGVTISFGEWMAKMVPFVVIMLLIGWIVLRILFPFKQKRIELDIKGELKKQKDTYIVAITFLVTVFLWCFGDLFNLGLNSYIIALIPVAVFIVGGIFNRRDLEQINWGVLWMVAGGFALGVALNYTRLSNHLVESIPFATWPFLIVTIVAMLVCFGFSNLISHSATAALLVPVIGVIAGAMHSATGDAAIPRQMLVAVALAASVSMILPISTPPNAIAHSTGYIEQKDMVKVGVIIGIVGLVGGLGWLMLVF